MEDGRLKETPHTVLGEFPKLECPLKISDVFAAQRKIKDIAYVTPLEYSNTFSKMAGCKAYLKLENMQKTGSFKVRGAINKVFSLTDEERKKGVVAASAGNHAQGIAFASTMCGCESTIVMPEFAPAAKVEATKGYGAKVVLHGKAFNDALNYATELCESEGKIFCHPYNDKYVMAGQGTIALEILEQLKDVDVVIGAVGGGGLMSGVAYTIKTLKPDVRVIGVQSIECPSMALSMKEHKIVNITNPRTIADGINVAHPGDLTATVFNEYVDEVVTVDEEQIADAMVMMMERCKTISEGAGATPVAALLNGKIRGLTPNTNVVCIVSGGNADETTIDKVLERSLVRNCRIVDFTVGLVDVPGIIKKMLTIIQEEKAVVLHVSTRRPSSCGLNTCLCDLEIECAGVHHRDVIFKKLEDAEFTLIK